MLLCLVQNRHYKLTPVVKYIEKEILKNKVKFDLLKDVIHVRRNTKEYRRMALHLYEDSVLCLHAQQICGNKKSYYESMEEYHLKKSREQCLDLNEYRSRLEKERYLKVVEYDVAFDEVPF